ncbi:MAG: preprotein translocase subunit YajC [Fusobacteria bacterium]|jgi:preprotein translocase subunit YajC|nr:preprotein translocase subunit YajC [Fusobacteriota bacterium]
MNIFFNGLLFVVEGGQRLGQQEIATSDIATEGSATVGSFLPLIIMILVFFAWSFFLNKKQKKENQAYKNMVDSLKKGDKVVTRSGIIGEITSINEKIVELRVDKGTTITFQKEAIKGEYRD